jgi:hypothetical protein
MKLLKLLLIVTGMFLFSSGIRGQQNLVMADATRASAIPFHLQGGFLIEVEGRIGNLEA